MGVVSSGNSMDFVQADLDNMQAQGAAVKEMEAAGIAWSAHLFGTPFFALKSITDIVDGGRVAQEEFMENLATAAKALHVSGRSASCFAGSVQIAHELTAVHHPPYPASQWVECCCAVVSQWLPVQRPSGHHAICCAMQLSNLWDPGACRTHLGLC